MKLTLRAIELFELETKSKKAERESVEEEEDRHFFPSGARMYYMAGGIFLGMKRYQDAIPYLEKAVSISAKWEGIELYVRKMLVECYCRFIPPPSPDSSSEANDSRMLDILFRSEVPLSDLRPVLNGYFNVRGSDSLKWSVECTDDSDIMTPFSFSVTFPNSTHATAGDTVAATVFIKSNLNYPVNVSSVTLKNLTGQITVPSSDIMGADNAKKAIHGGVILLPMTDILFSTVIVLPRDIEKFPAEEGSSGNATVVTRPRTSAITSAGKFSFVLLALLHDCHTDIISALQLALVSFQRILSAPMEATGNGVRACSAENRYFAVECPFYSLLHMMMLLAKGLLLDLSRC